MTDENQNIDELLNEIYGLVGEEPQQDLQGELVEEAPENSIVEAQEAPTQDEQEDAQEDDRLEALENWKRPVRRPKKRPLWKKLLTVFVTFLIILVETVLLLAGAAYGAMYVLAKGPSPTARTMFVRSAKETSAGGFLAHLFFSDEEIAEIMGGVENPDYQVMDDSLVHIPTKPEDGSTEPTGPVADEWGLIDEDGDGIILEEVHGEGYTGYMMVVLDPSRVVMGTVPSSYGVRGYTVEAMVERFDAVAGVNGGGFYDPDGTGNGSIPDTMIVYDGQIYYSELGTRKGFAGFDKNHILHVGNFSTQDIKDRGIQFGVGFGPVLLINGQKVDDSILDSGVNPRTAIGQRADGAVLLLVVDGRQVSSLGASYKDLAEIFLSYGAVNACNLDGGSSSKMWYNGECINQNSSLIGSRPMPTTFLVLKEGAQDE